MPMMSKTTIISSSVKPAWRLAGPGTDVGIIAFAPGFSVSAQRKHVDLVVHTGIKVLIGCIPGVRGNAIHISRALVWPRYKDLETRVGRRIAAMVQPVELQRLHDGTDVLLGGDHTRLIGTIHNIGHHQRRQYAHNDDDHHDLYKRKASLRLWSANAAGEKKAVACHRLVRFTVASWFDIAGLNWIQ